MSDYILPEVVQEILSRLPVKTLLQYKTVCKAWRYMIQDPSFIQAHLHRQLLNSSNGGGQLMLRGTHDNENACSVPVESLIANPGDEGDEADHKIQAVPLDPDNKPWIRFDTEGGGFCHLLSSCNGVMLTSHIVGNAVTMVLWNPSTRESCDLPVHTSVFPSTDDDKIVFMSAGFGYDDEGCDYKVVNIAQRVNSVDWGNYESETMIYSLKSDSWQRIEDFPCFTESLSGVYLNGALYWLGWSEPLVCMDDLIIGIDLTTESYFQIPIPLEILNKPWNCSRELNVLGGCISLTCFHIDTPVVTEATEMTMDLWVLKEYGIGSSWTKLFSTAIQDFQHWPVLYSKRRGIVVLESRMSSPVEYVILDLKNNMQARKVTVDGAVSFKARTTYNLETLVRLHTIKGSRERERERERVRQGAN